MTDGLFTPELIMEVAEAGENYQITAKEFSDIMVVITEIFAAIVIISLSAILTEPIIRGFSKGTGIKVKEVAGVLIPVYHGVK